MSGLFLQWQSLYAERRIATFPVRDKKPAIKGWTGIGRPASAQLALKFGNDNAFGFPTGKRSRITVVDVDTTDEQALADEMIVQGTTHVIIRSGSGHFHAWYRYNGERRQIRPWPDKPIDILGEVGYVVAPPSIATKGSYQFIEGSLDDIDSLPVMRAPPTPGKDYTVGIAPLAPLAPLRDGDGRNTALFNRVRYLAKGATTEEELMKMAVQANDSFAEQLPLNEVQKITRKVWEYKEGGRLMVSGGEATCVMFDSEFAVLWSNPDAIALLMRLRLAHGWRNGEPFALARAMADTLKWTVPRFLKARGLLLEHRFLQMIHRGGDGPNDPPRVRLI